MQTTIQTQRVAQVVIPKRGPIWQTQTGVFTVSIWENTRVIDGRRVSAKSLSLTKSYRNRDGEQRKVTCYLMEHEVLKVIVALQTALSKMAYGRLDELEKCIEEEAQ